MKTKNLDLLEIGMFSDHKSMQIANTQIFSQIQTYLTNFNAHQIFEVFCTLEFLTHKQKHLAKINKIYTVFISYYIYIQFNFDQLQLGPVALLYNVHTSFDRLNIGRSLAR